MQILCGKYLCGIAVILTDIKPAVLPPTPVRGGVGGGFKLQRKKVYPIHYQTLRLSLMTSSVSS